MSFADCFNMEYGLTAAFFTSVPDMAEGIRAKLIQKTNAPKWDPNYLEKFKEIEKCLAKPSDKLKFHNQKDFANYPINFGLPAQGDIKRIVNENKRMSISSLVNRYLEQHNHKMGLAERLKETFSEHVIEDGGGLRWVDKK